MMGMGDLISRKAIRDMLIFNAWRHTEADDYSRGMTAGARIQAQIYKDCLHAMPVAQSSFERELADEILAELVRARAKFPGKNVTFAALVEEMGELATATFEESAAAVRKEAIQVAVMAMRMVLDGDHCFEPWRAEKGLDPLDPAVRRDAAMASGMTRPGDVLHDC